VVISLRNSAKSIVTRGFWAATGVATNATTAKEATLAASVRRRRV
jgi:hypothetical protein